MKKVILSAAIVFVAMQARAQVTIAPEIGLNMARETGHYGVNGGAQDFTGISMKPGLKAGAVVSFPVTNGFFIQPGMFFSMKGNRQKNESPTLSMKAWQSLNYLEVPLNLGYKYTLGKAGSIFITAGPYFGYALSGKAKTEWYSEGAPVATFDTKLTFGSDSTDARKPLDFGVNFSAGYELPLGLYARIQYGLGCLNTAALSDEIVVRERVLAFSIGYAFKPGKK